MIQIIMNKYRNFKRTKKITSWFCYLLEYLTNLNADNLYEGMRFPNTNCKSNIKDQIKQPQ